MRKFLKDTLALAFIVSFFVHVCAWLSIWATKQFDFNQRPPQQDKIEFVVLDKNPAEKKMQLVEQNEKAINDEIPEDAKYMSRHNQKVIRETVAKNHGDFVNSTGSGKNTTASAAATPKSESKPKMKPTKTDGTMPALAAFRPSFNPSQFMKKAEEGSGSEASKTNDHIKDKTPSMETILSTREFVYYTYYQRIRTQIRQYWEPSIRGKVKKIFASGRSIASEKDHVTRVIIILDKNGSLMNVQVVGESGVRDLDDAAIEAFRAAEPFPNPPKGIIEGDGRIRINWDFILEA
jgi:TonB family protein